MKDEFINLAVYDRSTVIADNHFNDKSIHIVQVPSNDDEASKATIDVSPDYKQNLTRTKSE